MTAVSLRQNLQQNQLLLLGLNGCPHLLAMESGG
jgi:hypothetical protein